MRISVAGPRILLLATVLWLCWFPLSSYDVWLHLGVGQEIFLRGEIPQTGWGSRLFAEKAWVAHEWAFQAAYYLIFENSGLVGLILLRAAIATLTAAVLLWAMGEAGAGPLAACAATSMGMYVGFTQLFWPSRPQIFTHLFLVILLAILFRGRRGKRRLMMVIPLLMALWVNLHGGYIIGLGVMVLFLLGDLLQPVFARPGDPKWRKDLLIYLVLGTAACILNPYTYEALVYPFSYYLGDPITLGNREWQPLILKDFLLYELLLIAAAAAVLSARAGPDPLLLLLGLGFFQMSVTSQRHVPLAALVMAIILGASWSPPSRIAPLLRDGRARIALTLLVMAASFALALPRHLGYPRIREGVWNVDRPLPEDEADYLEEHGLTEGLFNQYEWGGYLLFRFPGKDLLFIDGRNDLYGADHNQRYMLAMQADPRWKEWFDEWGVKVVLLRRDPAPPLAHVLDQDPDWQGAERPHVLVFVRQE
jgi:hypothetical protein